jgi:hypothetical protein
MTLLKSIVIILFLSIMSCCATKKDSNKTTQDPSKTAIKMNNTKMIEAGFLNATIVASNEVGDCPFTISVEDNNNNNALFDPINLDESFMKDGEKIWVKYFPLRMMNRCVKANPVKIVEIEKRVE